MITPSRPIAPHSTLPTDALPSEPNDIAATGVAEGERNEHRRHRDEMGEDHDRREPIRLRTSPDTYRQQIPSKVTFVTEFKTNGGSR